MERNLICHGENMPPFQIQERCHARGNLPGKLWLDGRKEDSGEWQRTVLFQSRIAIKFALIAMLTYRGGLTKALSHSDAMPCPRACIMLRARKMELV